MWLVNKSNNEDNPTWHEATTRANNDGFWEAMRRELEMLECVEAWTKVSCRVYKHIIINVGLR